MLFVNISIGVRQDDQRVFPPGLSISIMRTLLVLSKIKRIN